MPQNPLICPKCGGPRAIYPRAYRRPAAGGRWQYQCRICYNAARRRRWLRAHPAKTLATARQRWAHTLVTRATDWYIRSLLSQNTTTPPSAWPPAIVALKRNLILFKRTLWNQSQPTA